MAKFHIYKDGQAQYRWRLKSGNGEIIATSGEGYTTKANCENGIAAVKRDAPGATTEDDTAPK
jgi:uncharacterized protein